MKEFEARWIGWAGVNVPDEAGQRALTKALAEKVLIHRPPHVFATIFQFTTLHCLFEFKTGEIALLLFFLHEECFTYILHLFTLLILFS